MRGPVTLSQFYVLKDGIEVSKAFKTRGAARALINRKKRWNEYTNRTRTDRGDAAVPFTGYAIREVQYVFSQETDTPIC